MFKSEPFLLCVQSVVKLKDKSVLDIGCGDGLRTKGIAAVAKHVMAVDPDAEVIAQAKKENGAKNVEYRRADGRKLPFSDRIFDVVIFTMSFHHLPTKDMPPALDEALRVTKRGGYLAFFEPDWAGTIIEAERRFGFGDGDIRDVKAYAYHVMLTESRMAEVAEFFNQAVFTYRSVQEFAKLEQPRRGSRSEWKAFLEKNRYRLWADERTNIFRKK
ncbi:MAG: methyltransferase domain-containing protein [Candidatus Kerfeldbacteria bacterium]|nr:methyltransferase domain-containing protein [Candidatus Kerfeldbacteria bacterium]